MRLVYASLFILVVTSITQASASNKECEDRANREKVMAKAAEWITLHPIPQTYKFLDYNQNYSGPKPEQCCVTYSAEEVPGKPGCPAYRTLCMDHTLLEVEVDNHHYNGWCDY